ncbi:MAG: LacI family transcriptional regulator [Clostridiales bacterium]|nr:LacI family transcriptional regulator [Clostridiales bacterium]
MSDIKKRVTIYDIAKEAGVSSATVSRAISGNGYVSEKNKKNIEALVKKYNFKPNTFARNLQSGFSKTIGYVVPHIGNMYFASVYYEFEKWASLNGYMTILVNSKNERQLESKLLRSLLEKHVDGIVIMGGRVDEVNLEKRYIKEIKELNKTVPCVLCSEKAEDFGCCGIHVDDEIGMRLIIEHLASRNYKNIAMIGGGNTFVPSALKRQYAVKIAKEYSINLDVSKMVHSGFGYEVGYMDMKLLLEEKPYPDAVICINDYVAIGAMKAIHEAGLKIPDDIGITGYDNVAESYLTTTKITTISSNYHKYGKAVYDCLQGLIEKPNERKRETMLIKPELIVGEST